MLLYLPTLLGLLTLVNAAPQVKIGKTTLVGRDITLLKLDFFGGEIHNLSMISSFDEIQKSGIPFAEPPVGNLRLKPTVLKTKLDVDTFDASNFGKGCLQAASVRVPVLSPLELL